MCSLVREGSRGVWYHYVRDFSSASSVTASTAGSQFDTVLAVYSGTCTNLTCVAENDDILFLPPVRSSILSRTAVPGVRYFLYLEGKDNTHSGESRLTLSVSQLMVFAALVLSFHVVTNVLLFLHTDLLHRLRKASHASEHGRDEQVEKEADK